MISSPASLTPAADRNKSHVHLSCAREKKNYTPGIRLEMRCKWQGGERDLRSRSNSGAELVMQKGSLVARCLFQFPFHQNVMGGRLRVPIKELIPATFMRRRRVDLAISKHNTLGLVLNPFSLSLVLSLSFSLSLSLSISLSICLSLSRSLSRSVSLSLARSLALRLILSDQLLLLSVSEPALICPTSMMPPSPLVSTALPERIKKKKNFNQKSTGTTSLTLSLSLFLSLFLSLSLSLFPASLLSPHSHLPPPLLCLSTQRTPVSQQGLEIDRLFCINISLFFFAHKFLFSHFRQQLTDKDTVF